MPNEGDLKARWLRWARKQGVFGKSLGPHQIPGMPDMFLVDKGTSESIRRYTRSRVHWVEAKVAQDKPLVFSAKRDATSNQIRWLRQQAAMGVSAKWLILSKDGWCFLDADVAELTRQKWTGKRRAYGLKLVPVIEEDFGKDRDAQLAATDDAFAQIDADLISMKKGRK